MGCMVVCCGWLLLVFVVGLCWGCPLWSDGEERRLRRRFMWVCDVGVLWVCVVGVLWLPTLIRRGGVPPTWAGVVGHLCGRVLRVYVVCGLFVAEK